MHEKDRDIEKIIDRYLNNQFSRQDFIDLMESISQEKGISKFQHRLYEEWEKSMAEG